MRTHLLICQILLFSTVIFAQEKYETSNCIKVSPFDTQQIIVTKATKVVPTARQYEWQKMEFTCFVHFGINTFTGREWGTGKENAALFNPTNFNAKQWVEVAKSAGMRMLMLTAKHHDGFCLWQTQTTSHCVKNSPWKAGNGDILKEVAQAAREEGMKVGIYLSPADLHEIYRKGGTYGNGSKATLRKIPSNTRLQKTAKTLFSYKLDDYNEFFMNQLYEVLTQYGEISEVWFDGANPKPGTGQKYNYKDWYSMIRQLQPNAVIAIKGPDVRWIGNEAGHSRSDEWSVLPLQHSPESATWTDKMEKDLGSRERLKNAKYLYWYPAETDTPIRKGWFYRDEQQYVKTVEELLDIWYRSVGNNSVFLLNISPDQRGLIPVKDSTYMAKLGTLLRRSFKKNLLENAEIIATETKEGKSIESVKSSELTQSWKTNDGTKTAMITLSLDTMRLFNCLVLQEDIKNYGQRIEAFTLKVWKNKEWHQIYKGGTVGYKKIARFPMQKAQKIQLNITESRESPSLGFLGVYKAVEVLSSPLISRNKEGEVHFFCQTPDPIVYYTVDGTEPSVNALKYSKPFLLQEGGTVKAIAVIEGGKKQSEIVERVYDICAKDWRVQASTEVAGYEAAKAIDGDEKTLWHTPWKDTTVTFPHELIIDLGKKLEIKGVTYLPRQDGSQVGICTKYRIEGSLNGVDWELLHEGNFANIQNNPVLQETIFTPKRVRFIRWTALEAVGGKTFISVAEIGVLTK